MARYMLFYVRVIFLGPIWNLLRALVYSSLQIFTPAQGWQLVAVRATDRRDIRFRRRL
jgi:hypothetical protein